MSEQKGLSVRELLKDTYRMLEKRNQHQKIILPSKTLTEIANDSDWHRTRVGYMGYESASLFKFDSKTWAIARGEACGAYPAEPYDSNILAVETALEKESKRKLRKKTPKELTEDIKNAIERSEYLKNSLVCGMYDGRLAMNKESRFGKIIELLRPEISNFIAQELETREDVLHLDLRPVVSSAVRYKQEFVAYLVEVIETVLKQ